MHIRGGDVNAAAMHESYVAAQGSAWAAEVTPGADVAGVSPVPVQMWRGELSPVGADVA